MYVRSKQKSTFFTLIFLFQTNGFDVFFWGGEFDRVFCFKFAFAL